MGADAGAGKRFKEQEKPTLLLSRHRQRIHRISSLAIDSFPADV